MAALGAVLPLEEPVDPARYIDPSVVGPGFIGFVLLVGLCVATFFLWRSMNKQLKRIDFDEGPQQRPPNAPFTSDDVDPSPGR